MSAESTIDYYHEQFKNKGQKRSRDSPDDKPALHNSSKPADGNTAELRKNYEATGTLDPRKPVKPNKKKSRINLSVSHEAQNTSTEEDSSQEEEGDIFSDPVKQATEKAMNNSKALQEDMQEEQELVKALEESLHEDYEEDVSIVDSPEPDNRNNRERSREGSAQEGDPADEEETVAADSQKDPS